VSKGLWSVFQGDCLAVLKTLPDESVHCCVTSPPYWGLRDYGVAGQLGLEPTPEEYVARMVEVFREVRRVLRGDGTCWLNLGDSYNAYNGNAGPGSGISAGAACDTQRPKLESGHGLRTKGLKPKDLVGIPWRTAFALQADGWYLRSDIIWSKPNPMPSSVKDRCTTSHEYIFMLARSKRYYFDSEAIAEPAAYAGESRGGSTSRYEQNDAGMDSKVYDTRNKRSVWSVCPASYKAAHFATFPPKLIEPCILAGCPAGGLVLDPFGGSGTTAQVAVELGRRALLIELNPEYVALIRSRMATAQPPLPGLDSSLAVPEGLVTGLERGDFDGL